MENNNLVRELYKIADVLETVNAHFNYEAQMNAALHMASEVRPAPLAAAVATSLGALDRLLETLESENGK